MSIPDTHIFTNRRDANELCSQEKTNTPESDGMCIYFISFSEFG